MTPSDSYNGSDSLHRLSDQISANTRDPTVEGKAALRVRFDRIFQRRTGFATLDRLLVRLCANKAELLAAFDRPDVPLHTNGAENYIRCQIIRRKISRSTRSCEGRDCRDAVVGLAKICTKLGISFWDYLGASRMLKKSLPISSVMVPWGGGWGWRCAATTRFVADFSAT